jgi:hypothetical protein
MRLNVLFVSRFCLLALLALVAITSLRFADSGVARADDPVPTYYFSATSGALTTVGTYWAVDTKQSYGSYRIFKIISVQGNPQHLVQQVNGTGPNGNGDYSLLICPIQPGGEDDLPLAYFYVSGL